MRFYIIHLQSAKKRQINISKLKKNLPGEVVIIDAIDSKKLTKNDIEKSYFKNLYRPFYPFDLSSTEVACFLSHRKAWMKILENDPTGAFILEDDVDIDIDLFNQSIEISQAGKKIDDFIRFPIKNRERVKKLIIKSSKQALFLPKVTGLGMVCQFVGNTEAKKLLESSVKFDRPVDNFLQLSWITKVQPKVIFPSGVSEISNTLGGTTIHKKLPLLQKIIKEFLRPIFRAKMQFYSFFKKTI